MYGLHPVLPFYLTAEWRRMAGEGFASEHAAAEDALLTAYSAFGSWLIGQLQAGAAESAITLIERQRRTMGRLLGFALSKKRYAMAQSLMQPLVQFWRSRGLEAEERAWGDRCLKALEGDDGIPPDLNGEAGELWFVVASLEGDRAILAGHPDAAYTTYDRIRQRLEASSAPDRRLASLYYQIGRVVQDRGDLAAADGWYRKALEVEEGRGDRSGIAITYHGLGIVAWRRGDLDAAEGWYHKALEIEEALGTRPLMATTYHQLGILAHHRDDLVAAEGWYRKALEINEALGNRLDMQYPPPTRHGSAGPWRSCHR
jgi:tetratricopeptide (TPR) repeat protein